MGLMEQNNTVISTPEKIESMGQGMECMPEVPATQELKQEDCELGLHSQLKKKEGKELLVTLTYQVITFLSH